MSAWGLLRASNRTDSSSVLCSSDRGDEGRLSEIQGTEAVQRDPPKLSCQQNLRLPGKGEVPRLQDGCQPAAEGADLAAAGNPVPSRPAARHPRHTLR